MASKTMKDISANIDKAIDDDDDPRGTQWSKTGLDQREAIGENPDSESNFDPDAQEGDPSDNDVRGHDFAFNGNSMKDMSGPNIPDGGGSPTPSYDGTKTLTGNRRQDMNTGRAMMAVHQAVDPSEGPVAAVMNHIQSGQATPQEMMMLKSILGGQKY